jgi:alpha-mannosidase II
MLSNMMKNPSMKFIWAEISYFDLWWKGIGEKEKLNVKKLIERKQLEFVTGGWVMPDESSSHFYSILLQLTEGHQWLLNHLNYIPK